MKRLLLALLLAPLLAWGQSYPSPTFTWMHQITPGTSGCGTPQCLSSIFVGYGAGNAFTLSATEGFGSVGIGIDALQSFTTTNAETVCLGNLACEFEVSGVQNTAVGMHALGTDTNNTGAVIVGNDAARDSTFTAGYTVAIGQEAVAHGNNGTVTAVGSQAHRGMSGAVVLGGTLTTGDTLQVTLTASASGLTGSPVTKTYTVLNTDTLATAATALAALLNGTISGPSYQLQAFSNPVPGGATYLIDFNFPGLQTTGWQIVPTVAVGGSATETLTVLNGTVGLQNTAVGRNSMAGFQQTTAANDTCIGDSTCPYLTTGSRNTVTGSGAGNALVTSTDNTIDGYQACKSLTGTNNTCIGSQAGLSATLGSYNTFVGYQAGLVSTGNVDVTIVGGYSCPQISSGSQDTCVGTGVAQSASGSNAMSNSTLMGHHAGVNLSGNQSTIIGSLTAATATTNGNHTILGYSIDVPSSGTSGWLAIGNGALTVPIAGNMTALTSGALSSCGSSPSITSQSSDVRGTFTTGSGTTACTLTFTTTRSAAPTCVVTGRGGVAPTYAPTASTLVLSVAVASSTYDYICFGS